MSTEATTPSDCGVICEACEHFNPQDTKFCESCGFHFANVDVSLEETVLDTDIDLSVVNCPVREEDVEQLRQTLSRIADTERWFPGQLHWIDGKGVFEQHLPVGWRRSNDEPLPPMETLESVAGFLEDIHRAGFRVNSLHLRGLVLNEHDTCVGLCLPTSLTRLDQAASETPLSGLNCCFAAPEVQQFTDADAGPASDVFCLAALFFYLHSGLTPVDLCSVRFELPFSEDLFAPALRACLQRSLSLNPSDRPRTPSDFVAEVVAAARLDCARLSFQPIAVGHTEIGLGGRESNEDAFGIQFHSSGGWLGTAGVGAVVVADGMGGGRYGERASAHCVTSVVQSLAAAEKLVGKECFRPATWCDHARQWTLRLNQQVIDLGKRLGAPDDIGSTLSALVWIGNEALLLQVGDSVVYRFRGDELSQISETQNLASQPDQHRGLSVDDEDAQYFLTSSMGSDSCCPDVKQFTLEANDTYLIVSDGITEGLNENELEQILRSHDSPHEMLQQIFSCCKNKIRKDQSDSNGDERTFYSDNLTAVILHCGQADLESSASDLPGS